MTEKPFEELRKAISSQPPGSGSNLKQIVEKLAPLLNLLTSSKELSASQITSLNDILSQSMLALYKLHAAPALKFAASIFVDLFKSRISRLMKLESQAEVKKGLAIWEAVLCSVLNGIQTYMDDDNADVVSLGSAFYKPLFGVLSSALGLKMGARIRVQAYQMLSDAAEGCNKNKALLRDKNVLGGNRLGGIIAATNEYLVLDSLFHLLTRLTPSSTDTEGRASLAAEVFQNPKAKKTFGNESCDRLAEIFRNAKGKEWDKATEQILVEMATTDILRTQPFYLINSKVQANSVVYMQHPPLDYLYVDSNNFVVNVQDGESIDSLEVDYHSVTSIHVTRSSAKGDKKIVHIKMSLSSPPMKGPDPVLFPSASDVRGDFIEFDISATDLSRFDAALQARAMGGLIQPNNSQSARAKRSMGTLDLNLINVTSKSLAEKSEDVQKLYANSSPSPRVIEDATARHTNRVEARSRDDVTKFPREQPSTSDPLEPKHSNGAPPKGTIGRPEEDESGAVRRRNTNSKTGKPRPTRIPKTTKAIILVDDEPLTDIEDLDVTAVSKAVPDTETHEVVRNSKRSGVSKGQEPEAKPTDVDITQTGLLSKPTTPRKAQEVLGTHKRKRAVETNNENISIDAEDEPGRQDGHPYNSQLLHQPETATTRSSIKYHARAKRILSSPSGFTGTDFDVIPTASSGSPPHVAQTTVKRAHRELKSKPKVIVTTGKSAKTKSGKLEKGHPVHPVAESSVVRRTQRVSKKPRISEAEETGTEEREIPTTATRQQKAPAPIVTGEKNKKTKRAPWKDLDQSGVDADLNGSPRKLSIEGPASRNIVSMPIMSPSPINRHSVGAHPISTEEHDPKSSSPALAPAQVLEPLDLDLAVSEAVNLDMDVEFDFDPVVSSRHEPDYSLIADVPAEDGSDGEASEAKTAEPYEENVESNDVELPDEKFLNFKSGHSATQTFEPRLPKSAPLRDTIMIDLTHVDDEPSQENIVEAILHNEGSSLRKDSLNKTTLARQRVSFAHDTKPPSCVRKPAPGVRTAPQTFFSSKGFSKKLTTSSFIPRLAIKSDASIFMDDKKFTGGILKAQAQQLKSHQKLQRMSPSFVGSDVEDVEMMNVDDKIIAVLNEIQEVIVYKMNTKFDIPKMHAHAARERLMATAAEDLKVLLAESFHRREQLVSLEVQYAEHGRKAKQALEDLNKTNEDTARQLHQIVSEHDRHSLSKKIPKTLVSPPQMFQRLVST